MKRHVFNEKTGKIGNQKIKLPGAKDLPKTQEGKLEHLLNICDPSKCQWHETRKESSWTS